MKSGQLMRQVVNKLIDDFDFNRSDDRHVFGDIYEQILRDLQSAGNAGEFYTPRAVTQFMVDQVNPKLGEKVLDPGTAKSEEEAKARRPATGEPTGAAECTGAAESTRRT